MRKMLRVFCIFQWVFIPILIIGAAEYGLKKTGEPKPEWYTTAGLIAEYHPVDFIFIGSSRVGAAIDSDIFQGRISALLGKKVTAINLGHGYTTIQLHYLGMRNLLRKFPRSFQNLTVFVEAPGDMANIKYNTHWDGEWVLKEQPQILVPFLIPSDMKSFLMKSSDSFASKTYVAFKYYLGKFKIIRSRERIKEKIDSWGIEELDQFFQKLFRIHPPDDRKKMDLASTGGIQTNPRLQERVRATAINFTNELLQGQGELGKWDNTVMDDFIRLIHSYNGRVIFFDMPSSSPFLNVFSKKVHQAQRADFYSLLPGWKSCVLHPDFRYSDEDFPDYWHLRRSRAEEFSTRLAESYYNFLKTKSPGTSNFSKKNIE